MSGPYRLLRASERTSIGHCRIFRGLGQMQPVLIGIERGGVSLRIEGVQDGRPCWHVLPLPRFKQRAKELFAELEKHQRDGTRGPAAEAWDEYQASRKAA